MRLLDFLANIKRKAEFPVPAGEIKIVRTCCPAHNCGGCCPLVARIQDGKIMRLDGIVIFGGVVLRRLKA